jgi:hypothetical protein
VENLSSLAGAEPFRVRNLRHPDEFGRQIEQQIAFAFCGIIDQAEQLLTSMIAQMPSPDHVRGQSSTRSSRIQTTTEAA